MCLPSDADSAVDSLESPSQYAVFKDNATKPKYLITVAREKLDEEDWKTKRSDRKLFALRVKQVRVMYFLEPPARRGGLSVHTCLSVRPCSSYNSSWDNYNVQSSNQLSETGSSIFTGSASSQRV